MKWGWLKNAGKIAGEAALQGAINSNPITATAVQVALAGGSDVNVQTLNALLIPHGYMVVPLPTGFTPVPGQATVSTSP